MTLLKIIKKKLGLTQDTTQYLDFTEFENQTIDFASPFTMTSPERMVTLIRASQYVIQSQLEGDIVECGVWKGGSIMAILNTLLKLNSTQKEVWLYDTFEGMPPPGGADKDPFGISAASKLQKNKDKSSNIWACSSLEEVQANVGETNYPESKIHYIKGKVEDTLPLEATDKICLLRLDTDWYESTKIELEILYDKIVPGGILIIDDYGHWQGCRKAVDEFIATRQLHLFLNRIDYTGRLIIKP